MVNDEPGQETVQQEPVKTAADLRIEQLEQRLNDLEQTNRELREANAGLWAAAHPVEQEPVQETVQVSAIPIKSDIETLYESLGIKE